MVIETLDSPVCVLTLPQARACFHALAYLAEKEPAFWKALALEEVARQTYQQLRTFVRDEQRPWVTPRAQKGAPKA